MIRVAFYLILVGLAAFGVAWFADRPGEVSVTWLGMQIETSVMVLLSALIAVIVLAIFGWSLLQALLRAPRRVRDFWHRRKDKRGHLALTKGLLAVGAGDAGLARRYADEANKFAANDPLTLLLSAQSAQLSGDRDGAERSFRRMTGADATRLLGLHGLYIEAERRKDANAARLYAEEAANLQPALPWAGQAVLQFRSIAGDWNGALAALERNRKSGAIDRDAYRRQRAVLLTAQAQADDARDRDNARDASLEAVKLAPDLVPAVTLAARFLSESGDIRKAMRMIEKAWDSAPHPDLADGYIHVRTGDAARERLARAEKLAGRDPDNIEGAIALARAAIDAGEFLAARQALIGHLDQPTRRVALLMAALELAESGNEGRAREWTARALRALPDPVWTADGVVSETWRPVSPVSGRLDAFVWKVPLAALAAPQAEIELTESAPRLVGEPERLEGRPEPTTEAAPPVLLAPETETTVAGEEIVPVVPVPDDPGPDPDRAPESGWKRFFS